MSKRQGGERHVRRIARKHHHYYIFQVLYLP